MKKTIRILTSLLVLLALLVSLPISAMADDLPNNTGTETPPMNVAYGDTMATNTGTIGTNEGTIGTNEGTITDNGKPQEDGTMSNPPSGTVENNQNDGRIENNYGTVSNNGIEGKGETSGTVDNNYGIISSNYGTVTDNKEGSTIYKNAADGLVTTNDGMVGINNGTIGTNEDSVFVNGGTFKNEVTGEYEALEGTITTNNGTVQENGTLGKIEGNNGQVTENYGVVTNKSGGEVVFNEGTVINEAGGKIYEYKFEESDEESENTPRKEITEAGTYYGVYVAKGYDKEAIKAGTWTDGEAILQKKQGEALDLRSIFTQTGYEVFGYTTLVDVENEITVESTSYKDDKPGYLTLLWRKIQEIIAPAPSSEPEATPVKAAALPTTVAAEDVKVGTVVRAKGQMFKVIEMDDGSMTVVTMGKLSKKDMEDLKAFLAKYFTPAQIELLLGEPELISGELAEKLFGGNTNHIVFKAARNLFAQ